MATTVKKVTVKKVAPKKVVEVNISGEKNHIEELEKEFASLKKIVLGIASRIVKQFGEG